MQSEIIAESELILNKDGSVYHLNLLPEDISDTVITVGDPERVEMVSRYFDKIELKKQKREFVTHTGYIGKKRLTVISTGIGTDNIDIVINELDALVNIDLKKRIVNESLKTLDIIRVGTSGSLQENIPIDSYVVSKYALSMDGLMHYYKFDNISEDIEILSAFSGHVKNFNKFSPYLIPGSTTLIDKLGYDMQQGITVTCSGFYGPQGRVLRGQLTCPGLNEKLTCFKFKDHRITNFEMETAGIYGLAKVFGHNACSINTIIANRVTKNFSKNIEKAVKQMIETTLERLVSSM